MAAAITRIQKRLGPLETKTALGYLVEDNITGCFHILLKYYDKLYSKGLANRPETNKQIITVPSEFPGSPEAAEAILETKSKAYV